MATHYSDVEKFPKFGSFIRAVIGLPYTPVERLQEAMRILEKLAMSTHPTLQNFCLNLIYYLETTWISGSIPVEVWNMYDHRGVTTNNHAEAFNFKMGSKKQISKHPNPYVLAEEMVAQLIEGSDTATADILSSKSKKINSKLQKMRIRRKALMRDLAKRNVDLQTYLIAVGASTLKYTPQIQEDPDPLADMVDRPADYVPCQIMSHLASDSASVPPEPTSACPETNADARKQIKGRDSSKGLFLSQSSLSLELTLPLMLWKLQ